jgi:hypothetical protein
MNRRDFLKVVAAIAGAAAIPPALAKSLPEVIPEDWYVALYSEEPGVVGEVTYSEYARVSVPRNTEFGEIIFPEATGNVLVTRCLICMGDRSVDAPLTRKLQLTYGVTPMFLPGELRITED